MNATEPNFYQDPAIIQDSRSYFELMRTKGPVAWEPHYNTLIVTGYEEARQVLEDKTGIFSNKASVVGPIPGLPFEPEGSDIRDQLAEHQGEMPWADHLVCFDGEKHAKHRMLMGSLLTFKRLKQNEEYLYATSDRLIDAFIDKGECSVMPEYAHATTVYAISDLLGIPLEDRPILLQQIGAPPSQLDGDAEMKMGPDPLIGMKALFDGYLQDRVENDRGDLMSELIRAEFKDGTKPDFDTVSNLSRFLFGAGQDTTSRLIAMSILILAEDPELQERLRAEPDRIKDFLEEVMRFEAPVKVSYRLALEDAKVGEVDVPAGTILTVALSGANADPRKFDRPDVFDIDREQVRDHMGFSRGVHGCLGAPLGRMEARIAIERLLARTRNIRIDERHHGPPDARDFPTKQTYTFRSLADLFITFDPA